MKNKTNRKGEIRKGKYGLTFQIISYINNKRVKVKVLETGETKWTTYERFAKGKVGVDLFNYPLNGECKFKTAKIIATAVTLAVVATITAITFFALK